jgi:hypothetical protein
VCRVVARKIHLFFTYMQLFSWSASSHGRRGRREREREMQRHKRETRQGRAVLLYNPILYYMRYVRQGCTHIPWVPQWQLPLPLPLLSLSSPWVWVGHASMRRRWIEELAAGPSNCMVHGVICPSVFSSTMLLLQRSVNATLLLVLVRLADKPCSFGW